MVFEEFKILARSSNLVPVYEMITADLLTPVLAYLKIRQNNKLSFLLESVEGSANMARYSFIGCDPQKIIFNRGNQITLISNGKKEVRKESIFEFIRKELKDYKQSQVDELPDFKGGLVGYLGYENISLVEKVITFKNTESENPDSIFGLYNTVLAFDHYKHRIILINNIRINKEIDLEEQFEKAKIEISVLKNRLKAEIIIPEEFKVKKELEDTIDEKTFHIQVNQIKKEIGEGEIFQLVLSKRFGAEYSGDPFNVYRALRIINPSPYMYYFELSSPGAGLGNNFKIIGTSPEDLLKVKNRKAQVLPIAGTRKRGASPEEEKELEEDLLNDPKELAEHTMLVDLGRNDLGRVCKYGTVSVTEKMKIQKYSHVIHLVSKVEGILADDKDTIDALMSCFPAGTVSGAPKIRAIQLIEESEKVTRNVYAGAVGYFDFSGNLDMCIAIRTLFANDNKIFWQAGAGIVADSKPELEAKEIRNKSAAMVSALKYAEGINENSGN
jgi:anthranilate synthase component 1